MGIKTYNEIEKYLEIESRNKKDDKRVPYLFENSSLGSRLNRFIKYQNNNDIDANSMENDFIRRLEIPRPTYNEIKARIMRNLVSDRNEPKCK
jgi:hypothetical protein